MRLSRILVSSGAFLLIASVCPRSEAANICSETVAANRMVDGIPGYSQCTATTSSAIYSNNGIDTSTTSGGTDWVRTQMSGGYQCTELAHRYLYFKWNVKSVPNGNAGTWCDGTIPAGLEKATTPMHGDLIVFAPGSCGADATTGHVAVIDVVNTNATVTFVEQNSASRRSCATSTAACFLHATTNTGVPIDGGTPDSPGADSGVASNSDANARNDAAVDRRSTDTASTGGVAGSGETVGTGGALAAGGSLGAGGVASAGGTGGASAVASSGGSPGASSSPPNTGPAAPSSNGCTCHLTDRRSTQRNLDGWAALAMLALSAGLVSARRRATRKHPRA
jgi:surface antigen